MNQLNAEKSFTLLELLIVIGILAILTTAAVVVLNPAELLKQARDSTRLVDLKTIDKALSFYQTQGGSSFGTSTTVYVSIPDISSTCANLGLPSLPSGWSYACASTSTFRKVDSTGWIPVNFASIPIGSLPVLPIDPINSTSTGNYYTYVPGGSWELTTKLESAQYGFGGSKDHSAFDGGDNFTRYEQGTNLQLNPHSFEFVAFATTTNNSQKPGWYRYSGAGTAVSILTDTDSSNFLRANGYVWNIWQENIPFDPNVLYELQCRIRQITEPTNGQKGIYCGWAGVAADGTTLVNAVGQNVYNSQHYRAAAGSILTAGAGYTTFIGYTKGYGSPNGDSGVCSNPNSPCLMHANVKFIRPLFILNYNGNGVADIDFIISQKR